MKKSKTALYTDRLCLKPRGLSDLDACIAMDRDLLVTQYISGPWNDHPDDHKEFIIGKMNETHSYPLGYWSIFHQDNLNLFLGWIMIVPIENKTDKLEMGWRLIQNAWGLGYATEASQKILSAAKGAFPRSEILAFIDPKNTGSIKIAKKMGMSNAQKTIENVPKDLIYAIKN